MAHTISESMAAFPELRLSLMVVFFLCTCHQEVRSTHFAVAGSFPAPTSHLSPIPPSSLTTYLPFHHKCCPVEAQRTHEEKSPEKDCMLAQGIALGPL